METLKFKTSLKCNGCVNAITPFMNSIEGVESWNADLNSADKIVEVVPGTKANSSLANEVIDKINRAGYKAEKI